MTKTKSRYNQIVEMIFKTAKEKKMDYRDLIRNWITLFEENKIEDWSRDKFLDECARVKLARERKEKKK